MLKEKIKSLAKDYAPEFIDIRHHLHANPELSYKEFETSKFVQGKLKEFAIPFEIKTTTGVVGVIKGKDRVKRSLLSVPTWMHCQSKKKIMLIINQNMKESCTPAVMM